jgi:serine/threonine protein kinase
MFDELVSSSFVELVQGANVLKQHDNYATRATELVREGAFIQREFLRIAPQVKADHPEAKRVIQESNDLLIRGRFLSDDAGDSVLSLATVHLLEAFGWVALGRFASDDEVPVHVAQCLNHGLEAESKLRKLHDGSAQQWGDAYVKMARGLLQTVKRFHSPKIAWSSATPAADFELRSFPNPPAYIGTSATERIESDRAAFVQRLIEVAALSTGRGINDAGFSVDKVLGAGAFGKVLLVNQASGGEKLALKVMRKKSVMAGLQAQQVLNERSIMLCLDHPYIVKSAGTYQDKESLYITLEHVSGGELMEIMLASKHGWLEKENVRLVTAEVALALCYLHSLDIVFRDMKPENLLVDASGHIKLTDFGFAKRVRNRVKCWTMCGTSEYMAPEILTNSGQTVAMDWWALGVLNYEMRYGRSPFAADTEFETYAAILEVRYKIPRHPVSEIVEDAFVAALLEHDPVSRLGPDTIEDHPYFSGLDWDQLRAREGMPPLPPTLIGAVAPNTKKSGLSTTSWSGADDTDGFGDTFRGF